MCLPGNRLIVPVAKVIDLGVDIFLIDVIVGIGMPLNFVGFLLSSDVRGPAFVYTETRVC